MKSCQTYKKDTALHQPWLLNKLNIRDIHLLTEQS